MGKKLRFVFDHMKGYRIAFLILAFAVVLFSFLNLFQSLVFSFVIDNVINSEPVTNVFLKLMTQMLGGMEYLRGHLYVVAVFLLICYAVSALLLHYRISRQADIAESLSKNIRDDLYDHIQLLPYSYHVRVKTGDLVQRCTSDIDTIRRFFSGQILEIFMIFSTIVIALFTLISISPRMALYASISYPIIFIYSYFFFKKIRKMFRASDEKESAMTSFLQEALSGVRVIKAFNREKYEMESFYRQNKDYVGVTYDMIKGVGTYWSVSYFICMLAILSVIVTGIYAVQGGLFSIGAFYVFITYQSRVIYQIRNLGRILSDFGKVVVSIDRLIEVKEEKTEDLGEGIKPELKGKIEFDHVYFHYADDESVEVLKDVSFTIDAGKTVAIIGPTGSGKSSLVNLLARLYDVTGGEIRIDGYPLTELTIINGIVVSSDKFQTVGKLNAHCDV